MSLIGSDPRRAVFDPLAYAVGNPWREAFQTLSRKQWWEGQALSLCLRSAG